MLSNEVVARARRLVGEHVLENLLAVSKKEWYEHAFTESLHPANRASFCLLEGGQEKEALNGIMPLKSPQPKILD